MFRVAGLEDKRKREIIFIEKLSAIRYSSERTFLAGTKYLQINE